MSKGKLGQKGGERWRFLKEGQKGKFPGKKWLQLPLYHQPHYVQLAAGAHLELYIQSAYQDLLGVLQIKLYNCGHIITCMLHIRI